MPPSCFFAVILCQIFNHENVATGAVSQPSGDIQKSHLSNDGPGEIAARSERTIY